MPAKAGIQGKRGLQAGMDPGLRRDDGMIWLNLAPFMKERNLLSADAAAFVIGTPVSAENPCLEKP